MPDSYLGLHIVFFIWHDGVSKKNYLIFGARDCFHSLLCIWTIAWSNIDTVVVTSLGPETLAISVLTTRAPKHDSSSGPVTTALKQPLLPSSFQSGAWLSESSAFIGLTILIVIGHQHSEQRRNAKMVRWTCHCPLSGEATGRGSRVGWWGVQTPHFVQESFLGFDLRKFDEKMSIPPRTPTACRPHHEFRIPHHLLCAQLLSIS